MTLLASTAHAEKIRTSIPGVNLNYLSVYSAEERKFFRDEGLENETISIGGPRRHRRVGQRRRRF
jgi:ABC-type nitrate/sulfonate/bicarbonate transport system substrate-binding protein